jgi:hypothetical protein
MKQYQFMKSKKSKLMFLAFLIVLGTSVHYLLTKQYESRQSVFMADAVAQSEALRQQAQEQAVQTISTEEARMVEVVRVADEAKAIAAQALEKAKQEAAAKAAAEAARRAAAKAAAAAGSKDPTYKLLFKINDGSQVFVNYGNTPSSMTYTGYITYDLEIYLKDNQLNIAIKNSDIIMFFPKDFYVMVYNLDRVLIYSYTP